MRRALTLSLLLALSTCAPPVDPSSLRWSSPAAGAMRTADAWLARLPEGEADRVLLDAEGLVALNASYEALDDGPRDLMADATADHAEIRRQVNAAIDSIEERQEKGELVVDRLAWGEAKIRARALTRADELRVAGEELELWCTPMREPVLKRGGSVAFDRNRCSEVHLGEPVRIMGRAPGGWALARTSYAIGWLASEAGLSPIIQPEELRRYRDQPARLVVTRDEGVASLPALRLGTSFPRDEAGSALVWFDGGWKSVASSAGLEEGPLPLTRRNALTLALAHLGRPYGWGGYRGGLDCSRFLHDALAPMGVALPRNSGAQASAGTRVVEVGGRSAAEKLEVLRASDRCGLTILQMAGHIMLYLGELDEDGTGRGSFAVSSVGEVGVPCPDCEPPQDVVVPLDRVEVTSLATGAGTARGSWLERLERIATIGACRE